MVLALCWQTTASAADLEKYLPKVEASALFKEADAIGKPQGEPPIAPLMKRGEVIGYAYLNSDLTSSIGYSGKPIHIVVGIDTKGVIRGIKLVDHKEPIVLIGIPEAKVVAALNSLVDSDMSAVAAGQNKPPQVEIVSGATVTVLVMGDSVVRSAVGLVRSGRLGNAPVQVAAADARRTVDLEIRDEQDWQALIGDGSVRSLKLSVGDVTQAFRDAKHDRAAENPETTNPEDEFIELYVAPVSVPSIGISLLGKDGFERLQKRLKPGRQAILVAGDGAYSFKGSGYVRGGIFDRIELMQDGQGVRFRDKNHTRIGDIMAEGAPRLREIALFEVPDGFGFDVTEPWDLQLLVQRGFGARDKANISYDLGYSLPEKYLAKQPEPAPAQPAATTADAPRQPQPVGEANAADILGEGNPLWVRMWEMNRANVVITAFAITVLVGIFFFQNSLVRHPRFFTWLRRSYLLFILVWLGFYNNAQLSVVNVLTFTNSLITGFNWEFFLTSPLIFILWASVAAGLLFWGRGPFCGWLCPFGALQELTNNLAQWLKVPQVKLPWGLHERLWPLKYMIFLGLFGLSLYSVALAEVFAEVEPFKTSIILKFAREWPFVIYALTLLTAGLFIERFYCRYMCPLGAALAIPGRIRMFEWLKRWPECGSPCHRCAKECPVEAIHPEGQINVNECIYCMHCQELYHDDQRCPHMIQVRVKREKFAARNAPLVAAAERGGGPARPVISVKGKPVEGVADTGPAV
ncbi:regulatory protein NosR [Brucella anthropi]|uniref:Regulatory protein NosR n=1 Tax=Brucella anthropi TaxID=529 RepID=A0A6L3Z6C6_BRUAN|nr:regulatory protein NosR [Brucella anthropi]KAB2770079.1 regulatory protein NosR [Brucella anthropi]